MYIYICIYIYIERERERDIVSQKDVRATRGSTNCTAQESGSTNTSQKFTDVRGQVQSDSRDGLIHKGQLTNNNNMTRNYKANKIAQLKSIRETDGRESGKPPETVSTHNT